MAEVRPALDRVRERAAQAAPLTPRQEAAIRRVDRQEFAHHLTEQDPAVRTMLRLLKAQLAPAHVRPEVETAALRDLVMRQPVVGTVAAGFL